VEKEGKEGEERGGAGLEGGRAGGEDRGRESGESWSDGEESEGGAARTSFVLEAREGEPPTRSGPQRPICWGLVWPPIRLHLRRHDVSNPHRQSLGESATLAPLEREKGRARARGRSGPARLLRPKGLMRAAPPTEDCRPQARSADRRAPRKRSRMLAASAAKDAARARERCTPEPG